VGERKGKPPIPTFRYWLGEMVADGRDGRDPGKLCEDLRISDVGGNANYNSSHSIKNFIRCSLNSSGSESISFL